MNNDMNVDSNTIEKINSKLKSINRNLTNANQQMIASLLQSQGGLEGGLEGQQFEKAKRVTIKNTELTGKTSNNIRHSIEYNEKILELLHRYEKCKYTGG